MAGPAVGRLPSGRPGETKGRAKLVEALPGAIADAGSIPAASIDLRARGVANRPSGRGADYALIVKRGVLSAACVAMLLAGPTTAATSGLPAIFPVPQSETALTGTVAVTPTVSL